MVRTGQSLPEYAGRTGRHPLCAHRGVPFIGTCGGFQHAVIEYARNVLGFQDAQHAEYDPYASHLFINALACSLAGKSMTIRLQPGSLAFRCYQTSEVSEQYYCNFGINPVYQPLVDEGGLRIVGRDSDGEARILEIPDHPFFVGTLFVPQVSSSVATPHPLIVAYVRSALAFKQVRESSPESAPA